MKLKNKRSYFTKIKILLLILFFVITSFFIITIKLFKNVSPFYLNYASMKTRNTISKVINTSSNKEDFSYMTSNDLFIITKNANNEIETIDYNLELVNDFLDNVTKNVEDKLNELSSKTIFKIPIGIIINNPLLNNLGPKIPVKVEFLSEVLSNVNVKVIDYGINNCLITLTVSLEVSAKVLLPLISEEIKISNEIPISYKLINGSIPMYYGGTIEKNYRNN